MLRASLDLHQIGFFLDLHVFLVEESQEVKRLLRSTLITLMWANLIDEVQSTLRKSENLTNIDSRSTKQNVPTQLVQVELL